MRRAFEFRRQLPLAGKDLGSVVSGRDDAAFFVNQDYSRPDRTWASFGDRTVWGDDGHVGALAAGDD